MTNIDPTRPQEPAGDDTEDGLVPTPHGQGHVLDGPDMDDQPRLEEVEDEVLDDDEGELGEEDFSGDDAPA